MTMRTAIVFLSFSFVLTLLCVAAAGAAQSVTKSTYATTGSPSTGSATSSEPSSFRTVEPGDDLPSIAQNMKFSRDTVWGSPANEPLRGPKEESVSNCPDPTKTDELMMWYWYLLMGC